MVKDLSHLPKDESGDGGGKRAQPPDKNPTFILPLVDAWWNTYVESGKATLAHSVEGTRFRASMAGMCARRLGYYFEDGDNSGQSDPVTVADAWRFEIGHYLHAEFQKYYLLAYPQAEVEVNIDFRPPPLALNGSAHADMAVEIDGKKTVVEIKSVNGYAYKMMASTFRGAPEGPKHGAFLQAALSATQLEADELVVAYLSLENLSPKLAEAVGSGDEIGRFAAQWTYTRDEFEPPALMEAARIQAVMDLVDEHDARAVPRSLVDPDVPPGAVIVDPGTSTWQKVELGKVVDTGKAWHGNYCAYCPYQTRCATDG
jgi:hypothetical protein